MTELRTLNQLWNEGYYGGMSCCEYGCSEVIKKEAIKWLKAFDNSIDSLDTWEDGTIKQKDEIKAIEYGAKIEFIKHFFDIKDEDLMEK